MVNTRSGSGVDQPPVTRIGRASSSGSAQQGQMDPAMQQSFQTQTQLLANLANTVANLQAQVNNPPQPPQQQAPMNKHREFMS
jgi:hypothetical protein